jgi:soluble lytic murein transglycosylase-like protein
MVIILLAAWKNPAYTPTVITMAAAAPKMEPYRPIVEEVELITLPASSPQPKARVNARKPNTHTNVVKKRLVRLNLQQEQLAQYIAKTYPKIDEAESRHLIDKVLAYSAMYSVDPILVVGIIATESGFDREALSHTGAIGYMQVHPRWHKDKYKGRDIWATETNVETGILILKDCLKRHGVANYDAALACYNGATTEEQAQRYTQTVYRHVSQLHRQLN